MKARLRILDSILWAAGRHGRLWSRGVLRADSYYINNDNDDNISDNHADSGKM